MVPQVLMFMMTMEWMTRKENKIKKKTTKPTVLPQKQALIREIKGKFHPFDSSVLKLNESSLICCNVLF